jgi:hypothetical protein
MRNVGSMATKADRQGKEELTKATAEKVFGWKTVHNYNGELIGKKQDRAGRWRKAKVPDYANDQRQAYAIDERMKALGRWDRFQKVLAIITKTKDLPADWAAPEQRCQAALRAVGGHPRSVSSKNAPNR